MLSETRSFEIGRPLLGVLAFDASNRRQQRLEGSTVLVVDRHEIVFLGGFVARVFFAFA